jgi:Tfp pilus assembly protein PilV
MNRKQLSGFSLIEVIIAFLVIAMGSASLVQLHRGYLRQESNSTQREEAMHLAESKLDDLRHFEVLRSATGKIAYQDIGLNAGGTIAAGTRTLTTGSFNLSWSCRLGTTSPCPALAIRKDITVTVSWTQSDSSARSLSLSSSISPQFSLGTNELSDNLSADDTQPAVNYTPGSAPDVVAVTIKTSGTKMETSKPLPTVYQSGASTVVQFETVTYDTLTQKLTQEDQLTLSCNCSKQSGGASYYLPASFGGFWATGAKSSKSYGLTSGNQNSQSPYCSICCNNHFDGSGSSFDQFFNQQRKHHDHYRLTGTTLTSSSSDYLEACRLLRIDGFYQPMPDWNLVALNIMSADYLSSSVNQANYERYVQYVVRQNYLQQKGSSVTIPSLNTWLAINASGANASTTVNTAVKAGSTTQLIARGIYVDRMENATDSYLNKLQATDADLLSKLPFNEINLTLLANWSIPDSVDQPYATITNEALQTIVDQSSNYYGTYSRGRLGAIKNTPTSGTAATVDIQATVKSSNSGITSTQAISPDDASAITTSTMGITISGGTSTTPVTFHGDIKCLTDPKNSKETTPQVCKSNEWNNLNVSSSSSGTSCTLTKPTGSNIEGFFECSVVRGSNVVISFTASGYLLTPNSISLSSTLTNQPTSVSWYQLNSTGGCSLMMVKSTVPSASTYSCN